MVGETDDWHVRPGKIDAAARRNDFAPPDPIGFEVIEKVDGMAAREVDRSVNAASEAARVEPGLSRPVLEHRPLDDEWHAGAVDFEELPVGEVGTSHGGVRRPLAIGDRAIAIGVDARLLLGGGYFGQVDDRVVGDAGDGDG